MTKSAFYILISGLLLSLTPWGGAQEEISETIELGSTEELIPEDKAYTAFAICAGYYSVMVDEFRLLPQAPEVDDTIVAYEEAGDLSLKLASIYATIDYAAEEIDRIVAAAISQETANLRLMIDKDLQLVGSLYNMICEKMIDEGLTALTG